MSLLDPSLRVAILLQADTAEENSRTASRGEPKLSISLFSTDSRRWNIPSIFHRRRYKQATCLALMVSGKLPQNYIIESTDSVGVCRVSSNPTRTAPWPVRVVGLPLASKCWLWICQDYNASRVITKLS